MNHLPVKKIDAKETLIELINKKLESLSRWREKLEDLKRTLASTHLQYVSRIGVLYVQLNKLELEIKHCKKIIKLVNSGISYVEALKISADELKAGKGKNASDFNDIEEEKKYQDILGKIPKERKNQLKKLLRELTKKFHPDLVNNHKDVKLRENIMKIVNEAYSRGDLETLEKLASQANINNHLPDTAEELIKKIDALEKSIFLIKKEIKELMELEVYKWKVKVDKAKKNNIDLYSQLEKEILGKIENKKEDLKTLKLLEQVK